jgi:hypothetical protein
MHRLEYDIRKNISVVTLTGDLPGTNTFCKRETTRNNPHQLSTSTKLLIYNIILKPIWTYGIQLWDTASTSNIEILESFQSKALSMIVDTPWYVPNTVI